MVKSNLIANIAGQAWVGALALAFVPAYLPVLGKEAFALVGLYVVLANFLSILDFGVSPTLNRELAANAAEGKLAISRDTLRTLELVYLAIAVLTAAILFLAAPLLVTYWLQNELIGDDDLRLTLRWMSAAVALQLVANFYAAGLAGLQHQVQLNLINGFFAACRYALVFPLLISFSATPVFFFQWQTAVGLLHALVLGFALWRRLSISSHRPKFAKNIFARTWQFSAAVFLTSLFGLAFSQLDRALLSSWLSLESFGLYSVASVIAMSIAPRIASPFFAALYPRFTQCLRTDNVERLRELYHDSSASLAALLIPTSLFLSFHAAAVLGLWGLDSATITFAAPILSVLALGCMLHGMLYIPYALQLAHGDVRISLYVNGLSLVVAFPSMWLMYQAAGALGLALVWVVLNLVAVVMGTFLVHRRVLPAAFPRWLLRDNGVLLLICSLLTALARQLLDARSLPSLALTLFVLICVSALIQYRLSPNLLRPNPS